MTWCLHALQLFRLLTLNEGLGRDGGGDGVVQAAGGAQEVQVILEERMMQVEHTAQLVLADVGEIGGSCHSRSEQQLEAAATTHSDHGSHYQEGAGSLTRAGEGGCA